MFKQASIVIPTIDETSIQSVVKQICQSCRREDIAEFLIVLSKKSPQEYASSCLNALQNCCEGIKIAVHTQPGEGIGDALFFGYQKACGSHVIALASDLENNPKDVSRMIALSKQYPNHIITASRRLAPDGFQMYPVGKKVLNDCFQFALKTLFSSKQTDITYMFQCVPRTAFETHAFSSNHNAFVLELALLPELANIPFIEISSPVSKRNEGKSHTGFCYYIGYLCRAVSFLCRKQKRKTVLQDQSGNEGA